MSTETKWAFARCLRTFWLLAVEPHHILATIVTNLKALLTVLLVFTLQAQCAVGCLSQQHSHAHQSDGQNPDNVACHDSHAAGHSTPDHVPAGKHTETGCADSSCEVAAANQAAKVILVIDHAEPIVESKLSISISDFVVANESQNFSPPPLSSDSRILSLRI